MKSAVLLNKIKELSFDANIEPVWNTKTCGTPVQLAILVLKYFLREEHGHLLLFGQIPTHSFTVALSVFGGTPPGKALKL